MTNKSEDLSDEFMEITRHYFKTTFKNYPYSYMGTKEMCLEQRKISLIKFATGEASTDYLELDSQIRVAQSVVDDLRSMLIAPSDSFFEECNINGEIEVPETKPDLTPRAIRLGLI